MRRTAGQKKKALSRNGQAALPADVVIAHRRETHVSVVSRGAEDIRFLFGRDRAGLFVRTAGARGRDAPPGKPFGKKKRLAPGAQVTASGVRIQFGTERRRGPLSEKDFAVRADRIREVYRAIFRSLQKLRPFLTRDMLYQEILACALDVIPASRAMMLVRKGGAWRVLCEKKSPGRGPLAGTVCTVITDRSAKTGQAVFFLTVKAGPETKPEITSAFCTPLRVQGRASGMLYLDVRSGAPAFQDVHIEVLEGISQLASALIRSTQKLVLVHMKSRLMEEAYFSTITSLASSIETRDNYTVAHTQRVTRIAELLARHMSWPPEKLHHIRLGGILHDIGKIGIRDEILKKPGRLTDTEREEMQRHPEIGANLVKNILFLRPVIPYILAHQEHFDGKGYPYHLKGRGIPIEGRLMAVADAFDAMTSDRPYRRALGAEKAMEEIIRSRGKQFDPEVVDAFYELYSKGLIAPVIDEQRKKGAGIICPFCSAMNLPPSVGEKTAGAACTGCGHPMTF